MKFQKGFKFVVPTKEQFAKLDWFVASNGDFYDGMTTFTAEMFEFRGEKLQVKHRSVFSDSWYKVDKSFVVNSVEKSPRNYAWPVGACLRATGNFPLPEHFKALNGPDMWDLPTVVECQHTKGSTPLMGYWICSKCGKDLEKV